MPETNRAPYGHKTQRELAVKEVHVQLEARELQGRLEHLETLLQEAAAPADSKTGARLREIVHILLELYGDGLNRLLAYVAAAGEVGRGITEKCAHDSVLSRLRVLHGLHPPLDVQTRAQQALDEVAPFLKSHGGNVELVRVADGIVSLRLHGHCDGCPSSSLTMKQTIEEAVIGKAPEIRSIELDKAEPSPVSQNRRVRMALPVP